MFSMGFEVADYESAIKCPKMQKKKIEKKKVPEYLFQ